LTGCHGEPRKGHGAKIAATVDSPPGTTSSTSTPLPKWSANLMA